MVGNKVVWQPQVVDEMLTYYKEKIQAERSQLVFKEVHHEECAKQINTKFSTTFTQRQVYHEFHKLKAQWKIILKDKDKRAKYINVPIRWFDEMEFIFQDKHATESSWSFKPLLIAHLFRTTTSLVIRMRLMSMFILICITI